LCFLYGNFQAWQLKWRRINCPLTWQFERCKTKQKSTWGRFLRSIRSPQSARPKCMFHCARWFPCPLSGLFSKLIFWKWSKPFINNIGKETRFFTCFQWTRRVKRRMLLYKMTMGWTLAPWEWSIWEGVIAWPKLCVIFQQNVFCMGWEPLHLSLDAKYISRLHSDDPS